ncbi:hypothetical protein TrVE_jg13567 [Triparma verrucosa]|uniref:RNA methyltransferase n=1 Tax=Triparma verrucosa TaxID=1606542 RepID=A0A9W7FI85_9STRA|nr:hypothetical protein TrVE_jg13567 [Triparma verrucosa]
MSWLLGQGSHLYNMFHLDEFQQAMERQENTATQDYELHDLRQTPANPTATANTKDEDDEDFILVSNPPSNISQALQTSQLDRGHRLGNFWNYPTYNPSSARLSLIPPSYFEKIPSSNPLTLTYVDLGCNEGELTLPFWYQLQSSSPSMQIKKALGIDIDKTLIDRARSRSLAGDILSMDASASEPSITFVDGDVTDLDFLGKSLDTLDTGRLTLITLFSTTMWLHLHLGDERFYLFLTYVCSRCDWFLVEPQPRKCYASANKRLRRMGREEIDLTECNLEDLEGRIKRSIEECGFERVEEGKEKKTHWNRRLMLFKRKEI